MTAGPSRAPPAVPCFRDAVPGDEPRIAQVVLWVAEAERAVHRLTATQANYTDLLFGQRAVLRGLLVEHGTALLGGALWTFVGGTFSGNRGLFVEDLSISPAHRGHGLGRALFAELARRAAAEGCDRLEWRVRDDNGPALRFYATLSAQPQSGITHMRLDGAPLAALAA